MATKKKEETLAANEEKTSKTKPKSTKKPKEVIELPEENQVIDNNVDENIDGIILVKQEETAKVVVNDTKTERKEESSKKQKKSKKEESYVNIKRRLDVDKDMGLTDDEVNERIKAGFINFSSQKTTKTAWEILRDNIFTFFNMLYVVITVLLIVAKSYGNLTYLFIVIPNTIISIVQEFKAKKMIENLNLVVATKANVVRGGNKLEIDQTAVVIDDVIVLKNGNQIYADAVVIDGTAEVNESMITGESDAIIKNIGDKLYSGSYLTSGTVYARVEHVGKDNYIEKLASEAKMQKKNKSELLRSLNLIIRIVGIIIVPLAALEFFTIYQSNGGLYSSTFEAFCKTISNVSGVVVGMIPSGLFLLTSVALVSGVLKLGKKHNTSVQELYCIEMLARADTLCLDKTGTITDGTMRVVDCVEIKNNTNYTIREIVGSMQSCFEESNATSEAMIRFFSKNNVLKPIAILPFSSKRKYSAVTFKDAGTFYLGAPEFILIDNYDKVKSRIERFAQQGCRVIALGHTVTGMKKEGISSAVRPIALIVIQDHIRDEAYETIEFFKNNGVDVKVISGDNPITVSEIAHRVGIANASRYVSLEGMSDDEVKEIAFDYTVFGRVTPSQKKALVEALKAKKRTVAMTGDGVNDILAMKEADCSIAMASGSEATRNIANVVLMDSNFASMPQVVSEGRRVINNVQRTSTLYLTKTLFIFFLAIFYLLLWTGNHMIHYPFEPSQMLVIEFFIIGLPSLIISVQKNKEIVSGKFILNILKSSIPGALCVLLSQLCLWLIAKSGNIIPGLSILAEDGSLSNIFVTVALIITMAICLSVLYRMSKPFNALKVVVFILSLVICVLSVLYCSGIDAMLKNMLPNFFKDGFLKMTWPLDLPITLTVIIGILLINPLFTLVYKFLDLFKRIRISN